MHTQAVALHVSQKIPIHPSFGLLHIHCCLDCHGKNWIVQLGLSGPLYPMRDLGLLVLFEADRADPEDSDGAKVCHLMHLLVGVHAVR